MSIYASGDVGGDSSPEDRFALVTDGELIAEGFAKLDELDANPASDTLFGVMRWAAEHLHTILDRWHALLVTTEQHYAAIALKQQRYAHDHGIYRGALQDADRVFTNLGVTNKPPRFVEALALEAIQR